MKKTLIKLVAGMTDHQVKIVGTLLGISATTVVALTIAIPTIFKLF